MGHFADIDEHSAEHDDGGRSKNTLDERPGEDTSVLRTWRPSHHGGVDRFNAKRLGGRAVHEDICVDVSTWW